MCADLSSTAYGCPGEPASTEQSQGLDSARRYYWRVNVGILCALGLLALLLRMVEGNSGDSESLSLGGLRLPNLCIYRLLTSEPCPGCGVTRAIALLTHGRVRAANQMHPSALWLGLWFVGQMVARLLMVLRTPRHRGWPLLDVVVSLATLTAAVYVPIMCHAMAASRR